MEELEGSRYRYCLICARRMFVDDKASTKGVMLVYRCYHKRQMRLGFPRNRDAMSMFEMMSESSGLDIRKIGGNSFSLEVALPTVVRPS